MHTTTGLTVTAHPHPLSAIRDVIAASATSVSAEVCGLGHRKGDLKSGRAADVLIVEGCTGFTPDDLVVGPATRDCRCPLVGCRDVNTAEGKHVFVSFATRTRPRLTGSLRSPSRNRDGRLPV